MKQINRLIVFLVFIFCLPAAVQAEPLAEQDISRLSRHREIEHILYEVYAKTDQGPASVLGYHFDRFITENAYFALGIFGAVGGGRGGYGIASFGFGYRLPLREGWNLDTKLLMGSGGGGGVPGGGGFATQVSGGLSVEIRENIFLDVKYGYLTFPTGTFETAIYNFGISHQFERLYLPFP